MKGIQLIFQQFIPFWALHGEVEAGIYVFYWTAIFFYNILLSYSLRNITHNVQDKQGILLRNGEIVLVI